MKRKKLTNKPFNHFYLKEICLAGVLMGFFILMRFAFKEINLINGYSPQVHLIVLALSLFCLGTIYFRIIFLLLCPVTMLIFGIKADFVLNHLLPIISFIPFLFLRNIVNFFWLDKQKNLKNTACIFGIIILMNLVVYLLIWFWYSLSGVVDYQYTWEASIIFNTPIAFISMAISIGVMIPSIYPIYLILDKTTKKNIYY